MEASSGARCASINRCHDVPEQRQARSRRVGRVDGRVIGGLNSGCNTMMVGDGYDDSTTRPRPWAIQFDECFDERRKVVERRPRSQRSTVCDGGRD